MRLWWEGCCGRGVGLFLLLLRNAFRNGGKSLNEERTMSGLLLQLLAG